MPPPTFHPSRNAIILVAVVQRHHSCHITHATAPNHSSHHPAVLAAHSALTTAPDFIFPSHLPPPPLPPQPLSSSALYLTRSDKLTRQSNSAFPSISRTFSNLSSSNNNLPRANTVLRRPTSSPPPSHKKSSPSPDPPDPTILDDDPCSHSIESRRCQFRATLLSTATHVFAITAQDGSRQYAFCRPLSPAHAIVILTSLSHTPVYVSALERTAATYANLVDDALSSPTPRTDPSQNPSDLQFLSSSFIADNIMRCPPDIAEHLTEALLTWVDACALSPSQDSPVTPVKPSPSTSYRTVPTNLKDHQQQLKVYYPNTDVDNHSGPCLISSTASSTLSAQGSKNPKETLDPISIWDTCTQQEPYSLWNAEPYSSVGATNSSSDRDIPTFPWEGITHASSSSSISAERIIELADATLLLRHFSVRTLISLIVALLEERHICLVGPNTAVVSRAVLALDNLVRPFKWPHLVSPILLAHILPVLGAPFPYLVGILEEHFPATKELPLEDVVFGDISSGKATTVEGPGDLYRHIPRRLRNRLERRLTRAKIACTRQILRSRSMLFSPNISNTATSIVEIDDHEEFAKKEKPSLLKRSRSFVKSSEVLPQNIWLDQETAISMDKAMRKFFAELLEGSLDLGETDDYGKFGRESKPEVCSPFLFQTGSSTGVPPGSSKRDSEKRQLAMSFQRTQMFMQWRNEATCDPFFGMRRSEAEPQPGSVSRKRSKDRDLSSQQKKGNVDPDEDLLMKSPKFKTRLTSDLDDIFSGDDGPTAETGAMRKRFRSKRNKLARRQGGRLQFGSDVVKNEVPVQSLGSSTDDKPSKQTDLLSAPEISISVGHITSTECETDFENEVPSRRPWLSLRLPSSPWNTTREGTTFPGRDGDTGSDVCEPSDEGEETDPFDEGEESADITDMFPIENVGTSWTRMRQWSRRKNKHSTRV